MAASETRRTGVVGVAGRDSEVHSLRQSGVGFPCCQNARSAARPFYRHAACGWTLNRLLALCVRIAEKTWKVACLGRRARWSQQRSVVGPPASTPDLAVVRDRRDVALRYLLAAADAAYTTYRLQGRHCGPPSLSFRRIRELCNTSSNCGYM